MTFAGALRSICLLACVSGALLVGGPTAAHAQSATDSKIFEAFTAFCGADLLDIEVSRRRALAHGWEPTDESASPRLMAQGKFARIAQPFLKSSGATRPHLFKRTIGERLIIAELSGGESSNGVHFCYVYDFDAQAENYGAMTRAWLGSEAKRVIRQPGYVSEEWYRPNPRFLRVQSRFAASTPAGEKLGAVGATLIVSQVEKSRDKF